MQAVAPPTPKFDVLHLDECFVAVSKPPGLLVHRTREASDQVFLLQELGAQLGRFLYPAHRLDRATSGVITFAFSGEDARLLQMSLNGGETRKEYLALVRGSTPEGQKGEKKNSPRRPKRSPRVPRELPRAPKEPSEGYVIKRGD